MQAKLLAVVVFLSLVAEIEGYPIYYHEMWTPGHLFDWFISVLSFRLSVYQIMCVLIWLFGRRKGAAARPIATLVQVSAAALTVSLLYGLVFGGQVKPIYTQIIAWSTTLVFTLAATKALTKVEDFRRVETAIVVAGVWRAGCAIAYYMKVRGRDWEFFPPHMTTHEDTVTFVVALLVLTSRAIELRTRGAVWLLGLAAPLILAAIQVNNRRLAWATLAGGLVVLYTILPAERKVARTLNRWLIRVSPVLILYVAIGWGRPEKIFKPLQAFSSMGGSGTAVDASTKARDIENASLLEMIKERPILGTGLGHEWKALDSTYSVPLSVFPLYYYSPHNSVLALLAFCGGLGFAGLWMIIPASVYLNARTYRRATDPRARSVAAMGIVEAVAYLNQAWGDMGAMGPTHIGPATIMGLGMAVAARLSVRSGAWPSGEQTHNAKGR